MLALLFNEQRSACWKRQFIQLEVLLTAGLLEWRSLDSGCMRRSTMRACSKHTESKERDKVLPVCLAAESACIMSGWTMCVHTAEWTTWLQNGSWLGRYFGIKCRIDKKSESINRFRNAWDEWNAKTASEEVENLANSLLSHPNTFAALESFEVFEKLSRAWTQRFAGKDVKIKLTIKLN